MSRLHETVIASRYVLNSRVIFDRMLQPLGEPTLRAAITIHTLLSSFYEP